MKKGTILYIREDYRVDDVEVTEKDYVDHIAYLEQVAKDRYFLGGGFVEKGGGMIIFEAASKAEAIKIADGDPLISRNLFTYDLSPWEMVVVSEGK